MCKIGLTLGKFMPPHKGHQLMIDFGASLCDRMIVLVSGSEEDTIPLTFRYNWLKKHYEGTNVEIIYDADIIKMSEVDENGVVISQHFWDAWIQKIKNIESNIDYVFTSDPYGKRLAKELKAEWLPVDPKREIFNISATDIRNNPNKHFNLIMDEAKSYFVKTVVIVGPESCGKTTLSIDLAYSFDTVYVPEYGRTLSELKNNCLVENDFKIIADAQETLTEILFKKANKILFQDTEMLTTYLFSKIYLNKDLTYIKNRAEKQKFDLYILLAPTVEWIDDGSRVISNDNDRWSFYYELKHLLDEYNKPYIIIDKKDYMERSVLAYTAIRKIMET